MTRPSWNTYFMEMAELVSTRSTCDRKHCGTVIVRDNRVLATGYNGALAGQPSCCDPETYWECSNCKTKYITEPEKISNNEYVCRKNISCAGKKVNGPLHGGHIIENLHCIRVVHSERNAIYAAARFGISLEGAKLIVNARPCIDCLMSIVSVGIREIIYKDSYSNSKGGDRVAELAASIPGFIFQKYEE
jgi:dCMP deaminase